MQKQFPNPASTSASKSTRKCHPIDCFHFSTALQSPQSSLHRSDTTFLNRKSTLPQSLVTVMENTAVRNGMFRDNFSVSESERILSCYFALGHDLSIPSKLCTHMIAFGKASLCSQVSLPVPISPIFDSSGIGLDANLRFKPGVSQATLRSLSKIKQLRPQLNIMLSLSSSNRAVAQMVPLVFLATAKEPLSGC